MKTSAGLLLYRARKPYLEVLLVHPGGPYWTRKDVGAWFIPKGGVEDGEEPLDTARREFAEETGFTSSAPYHPLGSIKQKSGKLVHAWAFAGDCDPAEVASNTFEVEWPPRSGKRCRFPEVDRAKFFSLAHARDSIHPSERPFLDRLEEFLRPRLSGEG